MVLLRRLPAAALLLLVAACATNADSSSESDEAEGEATEQQLVSNAVGTYRPEVAEGAHFEFLTLRSDRTYHASLNVTSPASQEEGKYRFAGNANGRYIVFNPGEYGSVTWRYERLPDGSLKMFWSPHTDATFRLVRSPNEAWCAAPTECALQNLPQPRCPGTWTCESNLCRYSTCSL
jgi:hypothetical protein